MARNEEKAQSMLNRWLTYKRSLGGQKPKTGRRPYNPQNIQKLEDCEKWRMQLLRDIGKKVMEIQNESMGEQRIRDLNDHINYLLREKAKWERRILELGGPNYRKFERIADEVVLSTTAPGLSDDRGYTYKYFGAARNLPEVKPLFERAEGTVDEPKKKKTRYDYRGIGIEYYGVDEAQELEKEEKEAEEQAYQESLAAWKKSLEQQTPETSAQKSDFDVEVPSKDKMEQLLVDWRKEDLLRKYASPALIEELGKQKEQVEVVLGKRKK